MANTNTPNKFERRAAFYQDGLKSLQEYQRTGEHITWKEARNWMKSWDTHDEQKPPQHYK